MSTVTALHQDRYLLKLTEQFDPNFPNIPWKAELYRDLGARGNELVTREYCRSREKAVEWAREMVARLRETRVQADPEWVRIDA